MGKKSWLHNFLLGLLYMIVMFPLFCFIYANYHKMNYILDNTILFFALVIGLTLFLLFSMVLKAPQTGARMLPLIIPLFFTLQYVNPTGFWVYAALAFEIILYFVILIVWLRKSDSSKAAKAISGMIAVPVILVTLAIIAIRILVPVEAYKEYISPQGTFTAYVTIDSDRGTGVETKIVICKNDEDMKTIFGRIHGEPVITHYDYYLELNNSHVLWMDDLNFQINDLCFCAEV